MTGRPAPRGLRTQSASPGGSRTHAASPRRSRGRAEPPRRSRTHFTAAAVAAVAVVVASALIGTGGSGSGTGGSGAGTGGSVPDTGADSRTLESIFQDDQYLIYVSTPTVAATLTTLKSLGANEIRATLLWSAVAPAAGSTVRPQFDATNPAAYPPAAWAPYDRLVELALARGIGVGFNLTPPGPLWATARGAPEATLANHYRPSATAFGEFVQAVATRYSGTYIPAGRSGADAAPLPRVSRWSIWNEPNQPGWLAPQWGTVAGTRVMQSPALYRAYVDAAFTALARAGHPPASDTILIGELAPRRLPGTSGCGYPSYDDPIAPLAFLRAL